MKTDALDITGTYSEATQRSTDALLSMVLDRTTDGVMLTDNRGVIVYVNQPLLRLFGYDAEDLMGQRMDVLLPDDVRDSHDEHVKDFVSTPQPRPMGREDLDIEGRRADGTLVPIDVQLNAVPGTSLIIATIRDMTEQRREAVDRAIVKIDLANARAQIDRLQSALDLVIQRLFGLGTSIAASASNETLLTERLASALHGIDQIIDAVQDGRQALGP